jgi:hypothetical protein
MRKALLPLILVLAVASAACNPIDWLLSLAGDDSPGVTAPGGDGDPTTTLPTAGRFPVYLDGVEVVLLESWPVQVQAVVRGNLPTPCSRLAWVVDGPDASGRITLTVFSTVDMDEICTQVLQPFEHAIPVGSFTSGSYVLVVNGVEYPFDI